MTTPTINIVYVAIPDSLIDGVLVELPQLISDNDLHISQQVLMVICTIMRVNTQSAGKVNQIYYYCCCCYCCCCYSD